MFERAWSAEVGTVTLTCEITIGATGAPTLTRGRGIASVARTGTGAYTLTLQDKYNDFLGGSVIGMMPGATAFVGVQVQLTSETVATTKTVLFKCIDAAGAGTLTDPTQLSKLFVTLKLANSSIS
jgi:hypothetical protein